jgi:hypothetical protein
LSKFVRLEAWKRDEQAQREFMQRVAEGSAPRKVCDEMGLPRSMTLEYVKTTPDLQARYRSALETWVEALAHETVEIADATEGTEEASHVSAAKLRCDTRFRLAAKLYREMFGEDVRPVLAVNISLGDVAREVRELEARLGITAPSAGMLPAPVEKAVAGEELI